MPPTTLPSGHEPETKKLLYNYLLSASLVASGYSLRFIGGHQTVLAGST